MSHNPSTWIGQVLAGKYRIDRFLGEGGMGVVLAATHLDLGEPRAVKLMQTSGAQNPGAVERFLREARAAARLRSPHVVRVHDIGRLDDGAPYIVMELLEGQSLSSLLRKRGSLSIEEAVTYLAQACDAIAEAHAAGIIHRDLKPANLFVCTAPDGSPCVKVLDFGIAKQIISSESDKNRGVLEVTGTSDIIGSPQYMSPEQMRSSKSVDPRADIWSLGVILYRMLTGHFPFEADSAPELFALVLTAPPHPPRAHLPDIPVAIENIILECLVKDPSLRIANISDLIERIHPYLPEWMRVRRARPSLFLPVPAQPAATETQRLSSGPPPPISNAPQSETPNFEPAEGARERGAPVSPRLPSEREAKTLLVTRGTDETTAPWGKTGRSERSPRNKFILVGVFIGLLIGFLSVVALNSSKLKAIESTPSGMGSELPIVGTQAPEKAMLEPQPTVAVVSSVTSAASVPDGASSLPQSSASRPQNPTAPKNPPPKTKTSEPTESAKSTPKSNPTKMTADPFGRDRK